MRYCLGCGIARRLPFTDKFIPIENLYTVNATVQLEFTSKNTLLL